MSTPPGSKVRLVGDSLHVVGGFIKLNNKNIELLGGKVAKRNHDVVADGAVNKL